MSTPMRPLPPAASAAKIVARYKRVGERSGWAAEHNNTLRTIYEAIIQPGDTVVDGGAHVGTHTIPMARAVGPTGRVIACEPLDEARQRLLAALASERLTEPTLATRVLTRRKQHQSEPKPSPRSIAALGIVEVHAKALTDHAGDTVEFLYFPERPGISGMRRHLLGTELAAETRSTTTTTIDELVGDDDVRFIKLDVEGAELMALQGAERVVRRSKPTVHLEAGFAGDDLRRGSQLRRDSPGSRAVFGTRADRRIPRHRRLRHGSLARRDPIHRRSHRIRRAIRVRRRRLTYRGVPPPPGSR